MPIFVFRVITFGVIGVDVQSQAYHHRPTVISSLHSVRDLKVVESSLDNDSRFCETLKSFVFREFPLLL